MKYIDLSVSLRKKVSSETLSSINYIFQIMSQAGHQCYLVGGSVRDLVLGRDVYDFDFTTSARPEEVMALFPRVIPTGFSHGTVTVLVKNDQFEVTTFRYDGRYSDGRRPDHVRFSDSLKEDLSRRDFTINAMAYDQLTGEFADHYNGLDDLEKNVIRTIGSPRERFREDYLRMLRAVRFASQLNFSLCDDVREAIIESSSFIKNIARERVREEFIKIIMSDSAETGVNLCDETGLLEHVIPDLVACRGVEQNHYHKYDVYTHCVKVLGACKSPHYQIRLAALFHDIGKPASKSFPEEKEEPVFYNHENVSAGIARRILKDLKFSNADIKWITHLIKNHMFHYTPQWSRGAVRRFVNKIGKEYLKDLFELREADRLGNGKRGRACAPIEEFKSLIDDVIKEDSALKVKDLDITGHDLMKAFALKPSPVLGRTLAFLLEKVLDDPSLNEREKLLRLSRDFLES